MAGGVVTGSGTSSNPYLIEDAEDFLYAHSNLGTQSYFSQNADIDFKGAVIPSSFFVRLYNGNGHSISNFKIIGTENYCSLFTCDRSGSEVKNLIVINGHVESTSSYVGMISASFTPILRVHNCASINGFVKGESYVGGIASRCDSGGSSIAIYNCYSSGIVEGSSYVGGIVGSVGGNSTSNPGEVAQCISSSEIRGVSYVGGIVGGEYNSSYKETRNCVYVGSKIVRLSGTLSTFGKINGDSEALASDCYSRDDVIFETH